MTGEGIEPSHGQFVKLLPFRLGYPAGRASCESRTHVAGLEDRGLNRLDQRGRKPTVRVELTSTIYKTVALADYAMLANEDSGQT